MSDDLNEATLTIVNLTGATIQFNWGTTALVIKSEPKVKLILSAFTQNTEYPFLVYNPQKFQGFYNLPDTTPGYLYVVDKTVAQHPSLSNRTDIMYLGAYKHSKVDGGMYIVDYFIKGGGNV